MESLETYRKLLGGTFIDLFPQPVSSDLLSDSNFARSMGIVTDGTVNFGEGVSFERNHLFNYLRKAHSSKESDPVVNDTQGVEWKIALIENETPVVSFTNNGRIIRSDKLWPLIVSQEEFREVLERKASLSNFSDSEISGIKSRFATNSPTNDDVVNLLADLDMSPYQRESLLKQLFHETVNDLSTLVPDDLRYFERIIGKFVNSKTIQEYSENELARFFNSRAKKEIETNDLLLCSHSAVSKLLAEHLKDSQSFEKIAAHAIATKHPILLIACYEIGLLNFQENSKVIIADIFTNLSSDNVRENLNTLCSLLIFIEGELSRLQLYKGQPPFVRRLAALSHAALILKITLDEKIAFNQIEQWANQQRGLYFYSQTLVDLRKEPRWLPIYLSGEQFHNELFGRIGLAVPEISQDSLLDLVQNGLKSSENYSHLSFLPGPLEGNSIPANIPAEFTEQIKVHLESTATLKSFNLLINSAQLWKIGEEQIERLTTLLGVAQHQLSDFHQDPNSVYQILNGLAQVACFSRSRKLASSLMILSRIYRDYLDVSEDIDNYLAMGIVASAAFEDQDEWAEYIGNWFSETALLPLDEKSISRAQAMIEIVCTIEPYLFYTCSRPLSTLKQLNKT